MVCEHLAPLEKELKDKMIKETYRGQPWSANCREWVYFDCVLNVESIKTRLALPVCVEVHVNDDVKSGVEAGLVCSLCHDAVMGVHSSVGKGKAIIM